MKRNGNAIDRQRRMMQPSENITEGAKMITVYGGWPTRAFRVAWALEEMGSEYQLHPVDLRNRSKDEELQKRNPAGFLPVFDDDGVCHGGVLLRLG